MFIRKLYSAIRGNLYFQLLRRIGVIYVLFTLCRLAFYLYNRGYYADRTAEELFRVFAGGLVFDTVAICYTNVIYVLMYLVPANCRYLPAYQAVAKYIYFITNGIALAANCMDTVYFPFTQRRSTFNIFREFSHGEDIGGIFLQSVVQNWYMALFFAALIIIMVWRYGGRLREEFILHRWPRHVVATMMMVVGMYLMVCGFRGSMKRSQRPVAPSNAGEYIAKTMDVPLVLNTPFSIYKTIERKGIERMQFFDGNEAEQIYTPVHIPPDSATFRPVNVMVIILESFGKEHFGFYNKDLDDGAYKGYTPFLDSLAANSLTFHYSYANGNKSIDALASTLAGIPAIPEPYVLSPHFDNRVRALPELLAEKGYETAFFSGGTNGAMGFSAFCRMMGFAKQFQRNEYTGDGGQWGIWGIWDEEFLQFTATKMSELREPFLSTLFTISSHHPFQIPERYTDTFAEGALPIHKCIRYSDMALRRFFATASRQPWFDNTLFVLTADHVNGIVHERYMTAPEFFAVPVIFYRPDGSLREYRHAVAQQLDITPTILGYLGYDSPWFSFGFDVNSEGDRFAVNYLNGSYQMYTDRWVLAFDGQAATALYAIDGALTENLISTQPDVAHALETKLKAFLQIYTARMADNQLTVNP